MTIRSACLFAAAALGAVAAPALAQDGRYDPGPPPPLPEVGAWEDEWVEDEAYEQEDSSWEHRETHSDGHDARPGEWRHPPEHGEAWAYPAEQRTQWLEQCRATYRGHRGRERGQIIGGVLGAVAGGVAGSEIAEGSDNLGGTLIGAGVGGLAGAAIGGAIGADSDRDRLDECEQYLLRYEQSYRGYGQGYASAHGEGAYGYHYPYPYPVMWVRVPIHTERRGDCGCETVVEEVVVEEAAPPPARRSKIRRVVPAADKRVRITK
jgi:hypothetical protein